MAASKSWFPILPKAAYLQNRQGHTQGHTHTPISKKIIIVLTYRPGLNYKSET